MENNSRNVDGLAEPFSSRGGSHHLQSHESPRFGGGGAWLSTTRRHTLAGTHPSGLAEPTLTTAIRRVRAFPRTYIPRSGGGSVADIACMALYCIALVEIQMFWTQSLLASQQSQSVITPTSGG